MATYVEPGQPDSDRFYPGRTVRRSGTLARAPIRFGAVAVLLWLTTGMLGCRQSDWRWTKSIDEEHVRREALGYIKYAIAYPHSATIRCQAIEALAQDAPRGAEGWFIEALADDSPAVRFAGCAALGRIRHTAAKPMIERRLGDENHSVRASAIFALHRMGDYSHSGELAEMLLYHKSKEVRGNAAMLFGLMGERKAGALLKRCRKDKSYMVVWQALESRLLLGDLDALPRVAAQVNSGREDIRVLAMLALGRAGKRQSIEVLRYRLNRKEDHIESRLAAARALGMLDNLDGLECARKALNWNEPATDARAGSPEDQIMRVRTMAALSLGAMGAESAVPDLESAMKKSEDPRIQLAAAWALLRIANRQQDSSPVGPPPLAPTGRR